MMFCMHVVSSAENRQGYLIKKKTFRGIEKLTFVREATADVFERYNNVWRSCFAYSYVLGFYLPPFYSAMFTNVTFLFVTDKEQYVPVQ